MPKVVVIGLDGAGFHLLDQWLNDEDLPTLSRLMQDGAWQRLQSSYPPVTSPAWRCYSTGVNPGKHGVFWWEQLDRETKTLTVPDSQSYDARNVWDYLGDEGHTSAVVNMPTTYPPEEINGWMVSGGGFEDDYTFPPELEDELETEIDYKNNLPVHKRLIKEDPDRIEDVNNLIDSKFQAAKYLRDTYQPDFLHISLFITNSIQHYVWGGDATKQMWKCVDRNIREFIRDDENIIIMSDHGSNKIDTIFHINTWLEQEGYLKTTGSTSNVLYDIGLDKETLIKYIEKLGVKELASSAMPKKLIEQIPDSQGGVGRGAKENKVIWEETLAIASGQGPVYVLAEGSNRDELKSEIQLKLEEVTSPNGSSIAQNVYDASEVYDGPYVDAGPDLIIDQADGVHIPDVLGSPDLFADPEDWKWDSENHQDGLFITNGPDIANLGELDSQPSLYDLTPTILHWYGLDVPNQLDGNVLKQIFGPESDPAMKCIQYSDMKIHKQDLGEASMDGEMLDRLRDLGYLSN